MIFTGGLFCNRSSIGLPVRSHCPLAARPLAPPRRTPRRILAIPLAAPRSCSVAVGRDVPIAPPRPVVARSARVPLPCASVAALHYTRALLGGAIGTSRPTAITPAKFACITQVASPRGVVRHTRSSPVSHRRARRRAPSPCAPLVSRCGRARCLAVGPPGSRRRTPH